MVRFGKDDRKIEVMRPYLAAQAAHRPVRGGRDRGRAGVPERVRRHPARPIAATAVWFTFHKADRRVTCFYFYLWDDEFGPAFIKICAYFPYPVKVWVNGHEWAKRQAGQAGIGFTELSNGFATCDDPAGLQAICDRLGPDDIDAFFDRWMSVLPLPLTDADRAAGYWWELSMRQIETSRTIVFDAPRHARGVLRSPGRRQPRHRPPRPRRAHLRRPPRPPGPAAEDRAGPTRPGSTPATPSGSR